jgi:hypothetical protein
VQHTRLAELKLDSSGILNAMHKHSNNQIIARARQRPIVCNESLLMHSAAVISKGTKLCRVLLMNVGPAWL